MKAKVCKTEWRVSCLGFDYEDSFHSARAAEAYAVRLAHQQGPAVTVQVVKSIWTERRPSASKGEPMKSPGHAGTGGGLPPGGD